MKRTSTNIATKNSLRSMVNEALNDVKRKSSIIKEFGMHNTDQSNKLGMADVGCYADGTHGDEYVGTKAIKLAMSYGFDANNSIESTERGEIDGDPEYKEGFDALSEMAVEYLNANATDGTVCFEFDGGDLMLTPMEDSYDDSDDNYDDTTGNNTMQNESIKQFVKKAVKDVLQEGFIGGMVTGFSTIGYTTASGKRNAEIVKEEDDNKPFVYCIDVQITNVTKGSSVDNMSDDLSELSGEAMTAFEWDEKNTNALSDVPSVYATFEFDNLEELNGFVQKAKSFINKKYRKEFGVAEKYKTRISGGMRDTQNIEESNTIRRSALVKTIVETINEELPNIVAGNNKPAGKRRLTQESLRNFKNRK